MTTLDEQLEIDLKTLSKQHKKVRFFTANSLPELDLLPTGIATLDLALRGGIPKGKIIHLYGPKNLGKTTLALTIAYQLQKQGIQSLHIDVEDRVHQGNVERYLEEYKDFNRDMLYIAKPTSAEEVVEIACSSENPFGLVIIDSVHAMHPQTEIEKIEKDPSDNVRMGAQASFLWKVMGRFKNAAAMNNTTFIFVNHVTENLSSSYAQLPSPPGGRAIPYAAMLELRLLSSIANKDVKGDVTTKFRVDKTTFSPCFLEGEIDITRGAVDLYKTLVNALEESNLVGKGGGGWYKDSDGNNIAHGKPKFADKLRNEPELYEHYYSLLLDYAKTVDKAMLEEKEESY